MTAFVPGKLPLHQIVLTQEYRCSQMQWVVLSFFVLTLRLYLQRVSLNPKLTVTVKPGIPEMLLGETPSLHLSSWFQMEGSWWPHQLSDPPLNFEAGWCCSVSNLSALQQCSIQLQWPLERTHNRRACFLKLADAALCTTYLHCSSLQYSWC